MNIIKGLVTGLETLAETGNPYVAAGAGLVTAVEGNGSSGAPGLGGGSPLGALSPFLDEMTAENPGEQQSVNALSSLVSQSDTGATSDAALLAASA